MIRWLGVGSMALILCGCVQNQTPIPVSTSTPAPQQPSESRGEPTTQKLKLVLDTFTDLKVQQGDVIRKGQILSDRPVLREPLEQQRWQLRDRLASLNSAAEVENITLAQAKVDQAKLRLEEARRAIAQFKTSSPWTAYAWQVLSLPQESTKLQQLEAQLKQAQGEWVLAKAQLQATQTKHRFADRQHLLQKAELLSHLQAVDTKLKQVGMVRSPYSGKLQRLKLTPTPEGKLLAELTIKLRDRS